MLLAIAALLVGWILSPNSAAGAVDDGLGREWREPAETLGLTWQQIAALCPQDGATACAGSVSGRNLDRWIWATRDQVTELFNQHLPLDPALPNQGQLSPEHPTVSGMYYFGLASAFPFDHTFTFTFNGAPYSSSTRVTGIAASLDAAGDAFAPSVGFGNSTISFGGSFSVASTIDPAVRPNAAGVWLWRPIGPDYSPPGIATQVDGAVGNLDWFVSDASLRWLIDEPDSMVTALAGCDDVTLDYDTAGETFDCAATSEGGNSTASVTVRRDATPPTLSCNGAVFELGGPFVQVTATVADATSGPLVQTVGAYANTSAPGIFDVALTASDRAGNQASTRCSYAVFVPDCHGRAPTILGTGASDSILGTQGDDVIHGLAGNDLILGLGGKDVICGGTGNDEIEGGAGDDDLDGGPGFDSIRGDGGADNCVSGEDRMSSCATYYEYVPHCGNGAGLALALVPLAWARRRMQRG